MDKKLPNLGLTVPMSDSVLQEIRRETDSPALTYDGAFRIDHAAAEELVGQLGVRNTERISQIALVTNAHDIISDQAPPGRLVLRLGDPANPQESAANPSFLTDVLAATLLRSSTFNPKIARDNKNLVPAVKLASLAGIVGGLALASLASRHSSQPLESVGIVTACTGFYLAAVQANHQNEHGFPLISRLTGAYRPPKGVDLSEIKPVFMPIEPAE